MIGGILLIVGTSIGGGMLALPVATATSGFWNTCLLMIACWFVMTFCAFLILEVNLWFPSNNNLISMAKGTLGLTGQIIAWLTFLLLLYSLLAAYIASGADVLSALLSRLQLNISPSIASGLVVLLLGSVVYQGISAIDYVNRSLMFVKLCAYFLLVIFALPSVNIELLPTGQPKYLLGAIGIMITSFGYATAIPSLRAYFHSDVKKLRFIILVGSLIPLFCYILWNFVIQAEIPSDGENGLIAIANSGHEVTLLTHTLTTLLNNKWITSFAHTFTSIGIATSFLGVALCLTDFLADGIKIAKKGWGNLLILSLAFLPPLVAVLFYPHAFLIGLNYAGFFCIILLILLPPLMVWSGRYCKNLAHGYQVIGGKIALASVIILAIITLLISKILS